VLHDLTKQVENERLYGELKQLNSELEGRILDATAYLAEQNAKLQWQTHEVERANRLKSEFPRQHVARAPDADQCVDRIRGAVARRVFGD
jgi:hypothetical protein